MKLKKPVRHHLPPLKASHVSPTTLAVVVIVALCVLASVAMVLHHAPGLIYSRCMGDDRGPVANVHGRQQQLQQLDQQPDAAPGPSSDHHQREASLPLPTAANQNNNTTPTPGPGSVLLTLAYGDMAGKILENDTFEATADKCGKNIGNLVWLYAASNCLLDPGSNKILTSSTIGARVPALILTPSANILWNLTDLMASESQQSMLAGFRNMRPSANASSGLAATPRFLLGLGVKGYESIGDSGRGDKHHPSDIGEAFTGQLQPSDYALHPTYVETLAAIGQGRGVIAVRGRFTEAVLHNHGARHAVALGCPSLFLNPMPDMGVVLQRKIDALGPQSRVIINMPQRWMPRLMTLLLRLALSSDRYTIVWQSPTDYWFNHRGIWDLKIHKVPPERIRWFRDYESWSAFVCTHDAVIGARIHGNMIGLSCPIPTLLIASDVRTFEMAENMRLPILTTNATIFRELGPTLDIKGVQDGGEHQTVRNLPTPKELFQAATGSFDAGAFDRNRYARAARYRDELTRFGLKPSQTIATLAELHTAAAASGDL